MEFKKLMTAVAVLGALSFGSTAVSANTGAGAAFDARYVTNSSCTSCHTGTPGTLLQMGTDWLAAGGTKDAGPSNWTTFDATYAAQFGGVDPNASTTTTTTTSSSSGGGCVVGSVTTPLTMVLAMLALGFFVRRKKD